MSTSKGYLMDARQVRITPGARVVYGFGVSRSVAMAEAVVEADPRDPSRVSVTASGRVRLRVVRRSYANGEKPVVDVAADRMTVVDALPDSPLPTQDEVNYDQLVTAIERRIGDAERLESGGDLDEHERRIDYGKPLADPQDPERRAYWLNNYREWTIRDWVELTKICQRLGKPFPFSEDDKPEG